MSNLMVCSVFDKAVEAYGQPVFVRHVGEAIRSFTDEVENPSSPFNRHPDDYVLYLIGSFNPDNGWLTAEQPTTLITGRQAVKPPPLQAAP